MKKFSKAYLEIISLNKNDIVVTSTCDTYDPNETPTVCVGRAG